MPVGLLRIGLAMLTVVWAVTGVMDSSRLREGYVLGAAFPGEAPITRVVEFSAAHKLAVVILSIGIVVGAVLTLLKRSNGFSVVAASAAGVLAVGIWSVREYGTLGSPLSAAQFAALVAVFVVGYWGHRQTKPRQGASGAT